MSDDYQSPFLTMIEIVLICAICLVSLIIIICAVCICLKLYCKLTAGWCKSQTCLVGKTAIITGANTGIGYETALDFAKRGARVILACRNRQKAEEARCRIIKETGNENILIKLIDLASFKSVRDFAQDVINSESRLDILVNNAAGAKGFTEERSIDDHNLTMQINYYSNFLLTNLLIGLMKKTEGSRIINLASIVARFAFFFDLNKLDFYTGTRRVYSYSKLCNILFTIELARRLKGTGITTYSLHPGAINTDLGKRIIGSWKLYFYVVKNLLLKTCREGAQTTIYCSVTKGLEKYNGEHFADCQRVSPYRTVTVPELPEKLWKLTENIVQLTPEEIQI